MIISRIRTPKVFNKIEGILLNKEKRAISGAEILLMDRDKIVKKILSNKQGRFSVSTDQANVDLQIEKEGYLESKQHWSGQSLVITLEKDENIIEKVEYFSLKTGLMILDGLVETLLVVTIILELFFFRFLPPLYVLPFFAVSIVNLLIWGFTSSKRS
jgi:hypothetical protein